MQKGYKRKEKGMAVLKFFIGLIVVAILVGVAYFFLQKVDYSDKIDNPDATMRAYVEMTASPDAQNGVVGAQVPETIDIVDITATSTVEPISVIEPIATVEIAMTPTPEPTPIATPTPTPVPTPEPTAIPSNLFAASKIGGFTVPALSNEIEGEITKMFVSPADNNGVVQIDGYAYINQELFDAAKSYPFMIITQKSSGRQIAYQSQQISGVTGDPHLTAICLNPSDADFETVIDVSKYSDGEYGIGVVLYYVMNDKKIYAYYEFPQTISIANGMATLSGADIGDASAFLPEDANAFLSDDEPVEEEFTADDFAAGSFVG